MNKRLHKSVARVAGHSVDSSPVDVGALAAAVPRNFAFPWILCDLSGLGTSEDSQQTLGASCVLCQDRREIQVFVRQSDLVFCVCECGFKATVVPVLRRTDAARNRTGLRAPLPCGERCVFLCTDIRYSRKYRVMPWH